ncbi:MAG TPA: dockerin type I repeat-containing protein, partial [Methanoculleus sp.]|nr:dockerin type I repeat-containing protein [Methanoculleus sp.]
NQFRIMFVDLKTGVLHGYPIRVNYTIENLQTMAAFNVYGYSQNVDEVNDYLTTWTNRLIGNTGEFSGWYVYGTPPESVKGDFDGNGIVDIGDVSKVAYMVVGKTAADPAADFNQNGKVDIGDAAKIACYFVGKIGEL